MAAILCSLYPQPTRSLASVSQMAGGELIKSRSLGIPIAFNANAGQSVKSAAESVIVDGRFLPSVIADAFGIDEAENQLRFVSSKTDLLGHRVDSFQQRHDGVEVFSGILKVHYRTDGDLRGATGRFYPIRKTIPTNPLLTDGVIDQIVADEFGRDAVIFDRSLVIVDPGWYGDPSLGPKLAYRLMVFRLEPYSEFGAILDANSGQLLDRWSLLCHAQDRAIYDGSGQSSIPGALARIEGDPATAIADVDAIYDYTGDAYDFFFNAYGRDGLDDAGGQSIGTARVDDTGVIPCPNAAYSFLLRQMLICEGAAADDVVIHEWMHGLTGETADLIYQNQPGQLNESFSDVFGELIDQYNSGAEIAGNPSGTPWTAHGSGGGTDVPNTLRTASCSTAPGLVDGARWVFGEDATPMNGPFRDLWRPDCFSHPASATDPLQTCSIPDNGGVHSGSGIVNHAFAMLCDGKSFNGFVVPAIGPVKTAAVWYRALNVYLTVGSDFHDAYIAFNMAADDLIGTTPNDPRTGLPSASVFSPADADAVNTALLAVELNAVGICGETMPTLDSTPSGTCATEEILLVADFESGLGTWTVANSSPTTPYDWTTVGDLPFGRAGSAMFIEGPNLGNCADHIEAATHDAVSPPIATPVDFESLTVTFDHFLEVEPRYDGGVIEIEINGGGFQEIPRPAFRHNGYNTSMFTSLEQGSTNPLESRTVFSGVGGEWGTTVVELASMVTPGDEIRLRFRFAKDNCFGFDDRGWWVDDVRVVVCRSSGDCNQNGIADEIDRVDGPAPEVLLDQRINHRAISNFSDLDPHPSLGVNLIAEDFEILRDRNVTAIRVRGGYSDDVPVADDFTIAIHDDGGGIPGALLHELHPVATTRQATGAVFHLNDEYAYELTLPQALPLSAGTYFISVYNNTAGSSGTWRWARAWFGWRPGTAFLGQGCPNWCRIGTANFAVEILGETVGRDRGDINGDGLRNMGDLPGFVEILLNGSDAIDADCSADMNDDGRADGLDIEPFANCIVSSICPD